MVEQKDTCADVSNGRTKKDTCAYVRNGRTKRYMRLCK